jgi:hypothetical protein
VEASRLTRPVVPVPRWLRGQISGFAQSSAHPPFVVFFFNGEKLEANGPNGKGCSGP